MRPVGVLFLVTFGILLISPFVLMFAKAHFHFKYLKMLDPDKLSKYSNFLDTSRNIFFNKYVMLFFPVFKRSKTSENTIELIRLGNKVNLYCKLIYGDLAFIVIYVITLIILFGEFN